MIDRLEEEVLRNKLLKPGERVLVGVSGGIDSVALLHALCQLSRKHQWQIDVVHVNHRMRGVESEEDAAYVRALCRELGVPCTVYNVDVMDALEKEGGNKQDIARKLRYQAFKTYAKEHDIHTVVLAHHAGDQVETVWMRLLRGTGVAGLGGMKKVVEWNGFKIVRPLLGVWKEQIEAYCEEQGLHPRLDSSNTQTEYTRNRVRLELLPLLSTYNENHKEHLLNLSHIVQEEEKVWDEWVRDAKEKTVVDEDDQEVTVHIPTLSSFPIALQRRTIKLLLSCLMEENEGVTLGFIEKIRHLMDHTRPSARLSIEQGVAVWREYDQLKMSRKERPHLDPMLRIPLQVPGVTVLTPLLGKIEVICRSSPIKENLPCQDWAVFDSDKLGSTFYARSRQEGDRITCSGMAGSKKVKKLLIDKKIPKDRRDIYPVVVAEEKILWIPSIQHSDHAKVDSSTQSFLYFLWSEE